MRRVLCISFLMSVGNMISNPLSAQTTSEALAAKAHAVLPQLDGKIVQSGLKQPVEVFRDRWGVAHIYAQNADDLFFAQGWVAAQDRLFQIDLWRRVARGETAEILGAEALPADRFARLVRYRSDMATEWASYSPDTQQIATAFTRGINAYIDSLGNKLPIEFSILGYRPKKWAPEDILGRMSGIVMSRNFVQEIARARLIAAVGADKAHKLAPTDPPVAYVPASALDMRDITKDIVAGYEMASKAIQFQFRKGDKDPVGYWDPPTTASNNWVVDASLSASGKPLLASDPHRAIALPSLRYLVHLHAPGWNAIGAGEPALPGIALGHNEHIAWGITIVTTDQADIFVEKTHSDDPTRYSVGEEWHKMDIVREQIPVKGQSKPIEMELRFTRHGPVIHQNEKKHLAFALKWSGSEPGGAAYLGGLAVSRARNRSEFLKALECWKIPSLNFVYADVEGEIGWVAAGLMPVRKQGDGLLPVPGWSGGYDWQGFLPVKELPQSFSPPRHWLATANHNILPKGYPHQISYEFAPAHRFLRIEQRLDEKKRFDLDDFQNIQHESKSLPGAALAKLLAKVPMSDPAVATYAKIITDWDGVLSRDSAAGVLYAMWLQELIARFYARAGYDRGTTDILKQLNNISFLLANLEKPTPFWFDTDANADRDEFLRSTLESAAQRATRLLGKDMSKWRWGALHTAAFHHPLEKLGPEYAKAFNLGPVERSGDANTPNNTKHDDDFKQIHGASYRHVFDLADWDRGRATSTPGQSGQLGSPHYGDLLPMWAEGQYFPLAYSRKKVEEVTTHRLTLTPK